jgi:hypothetical protein
MSANGNGHYWSKFCWRDWQNDEALQMCSLAAQGLWMRLLCLAHASEPVGHVLINGKRPTSDQIAFLVRSPRDQVEMLLRELEDAGVFSKTKGGVMFSRRMVRDAQVSETARENGKKGGNPKLRGLTPPLTGGLAEGLNLESESESESEKTPPVVPPWGDARRANGKQRFRSGALDLMVREGGFDYAH